MKRVVCFVGLVLTVASAGGLFGGTDPQARSKERQRAAEEQRKKHGSRNPNQPQRNVGFQDPTKLNAPIDNKDIQKILNDKTIIDTLTSQDDLKLKADEIYKVWEQGMHDFQPEDM